MGSYKCRAPTWCGQSVRLWREVSLKKVLTPQMLIGEWQQDALGTIWHWQTNVQPQQTAFVSQLPPTMAARQGKAALCRFLKVIYGCLMHFESVPQHIWSKSIKVMIPRLDILLFCCYCPTILHHPSSHIYFPGDIYNTFSFSPLPSLSLSLYMSFFPNTCRISWLFGVPPFLKLNSRPKISILKTSLQIFVITRQDHTWSGPINMNSVNPVL